MATVNGLTKERMLAIEAASVTDGDVVGDNLVLTRHDGSTIVAGNVRGPQGTAGTNGVNMTAGNRWGNGNSYVVNNTVGYNGRLYTCIQANTDKCPPFYNDYWTPVNAGSREVWPLVDPNFEAEDLDAYEMFWRSGTSTASLTSTAGEFESGQQALKIVLAASSSQRIYERGEVLVRGNEVITVNVRAKIVGAAAVAPVISVGLFQADKNGRPEPFGTGASEAGGTPLYGTLGTNWATFTFTVTAALAKPRSRLNVLVQQGAGNGSTVVIDRIEVSRIQTKLDLKADKTAVDAADSLARLTGKTQRLLNGGGIRTVNSNGVAWNQRFIVMGLGQGNGDTSQGYFAIEMPADGTVIPVYGHPSVTSVTVAAGQIPMTSWYALYYEIQPNDSATSLASRFRIVYYTTATTQQVPPNWIFIVMKNVDGYTSMYFWGDGRYQDVWRALTPASGWASSPTGSQKLAACYRDGNTIRLRGVITGSLTVGVTTTIAKVPLEYRPDSPSNFVSVGTTGGFVGWCTVTDLGAVSIHFKSPYATSTATVELSAISYVQI